MSTARVGLLLLSSLLGSWACQGSCASNPPREARPEAGIPDAGVPPESGPEPSAKPEPSPEPQKEAIAQVRPCNTPVSIPLAAGSVKSFSIEMDPSTGGCRLLADVGFSEGLQGLLTGTKNPSVEATPAWSIKDSSHGDLDGSGRTAHQLPYDQKITQVLTTSAAAQQVRLVFTIARDRLTVHALTYGP